MRPLPVLNVGYRSTLVMKSQVTAIPGMKRWTKPQDRYREIRPEGNRLLGFGESRAFLEALGIPGEILPTPGHTAHCVSLSLRPGEVLAFLGKNGAGKTTTVKILSSLLLPDRGEVRLLGKDPFKDPWALRHLGAVLEGNRNTYWRLTPLENLVYFGVARGMLAGGAPLEGPALLLAFLNGLLYLALGLFLFRRAVNRAKRLGLLHGY